MSHYRFSDAQRFAVWKVHGPACYWCGEPLRLQETTIDHVIPEHLEQKPEELERLKTHYGLPASFAINDYCNWLPTHERCNKNKGAKPLTMAPYVQAILEKLIRNVDDVRKAERKVGQDAKKDRVLAKIMVALESDEISESDLRELLGDDTERLYENVILHIDRTRWKVISINETEAFVSDGYYGGFTPIGDHPYLSSFVCPTCHEYGPWNGAVCMSCGHFSDAF